MHSSVLLSLFNSDEREKRGGDGKEEEDTIDSTLYSGWRRHSHDRKTKKNKKRRRALSVDQKKTTCMLYLQADHLFYGRMGSEEACIESMTRHVQRVNSIYKDIGSFLYLPPLNNIRYCAVSTIFISMPFS